MTSRAVNLLYKAKQIYPQSYLVAANLGSALAQAERYTEGLPELERALGLQPSSTLVLNNLAVLYARSDEFARALDFWNRSLAIDPRQPKDAADGRGGEDASVASQSRNEVNAAKPLWSLCLCGESVPLRAAARKRPFTTETQRPQRLRRVNFASRDLTNRIEPPTLANRD